MSEIDRMQYNKSMKLFAYGALMSKTHMDAIGIDHSTRQAASLPGYVLQFSKRQLHDPRIGAATIVKADPDDIVYGILYDLTDEAIAAIDIREEFPTGYTREPITVTLDNGSHVEAIAYIAHPDHIFDDLMPTAQYIRFLTESTDLLPEAYIAALKEVAHLKEDDA